MSADNKAARWAEASACEFRVNGDPIAQPRPRARNAGAHARVYSPQSHPVYAWRAAIVEAAAPHKPAEPLTGPVRVNLRFYFKRPQRLLRKRDPVARIWHTGKPDRDNLDKAVLDCLTDAGWWADDSQVCAGELTKFYCNKGGTPGLVVFVQELGGEK